MSLKAHPELANCSIDSPRVCQTCDNPYYNPANQMRSYGKQTNSNMSPMYIHMLIFQNFEKWACECTLATYLSLSVSHMTSFDLLGCNMGCHMSGTLVASQLSNLRAQDVLLKTINFLNFLAFFQWKVSHIFHFLKNLSMYVIKITK